MKTLVAACVTVALLGACEKRPANDTGAASRESADTMVTKREMRDTAIITHDTTVKSDTIHKRGTRPEKTDTIKKP
jgi:hypothetical protein